MASSTATTRSARRPFIIDRRCTGARTSRSALKYEGRALTFRVDGAAAVGAAAGLWAGGAVLSRSGNELTPDPVPVWADDGQHYVRVRRPNGKITLGPVKVAKGDDDSIAVVDADDLAQRRSTQGVTLDQALAREEVAVSIRRSSSGLERTSPDVRLLVTGQPNGPNCTLNFVVDDPRVHDTDIGDPPFLPTPQIPGQQARPGRGLFSRPSSVKAWQSRSWMRHGGQPRRAILHGGDLL